MKANKMEHEGQHRGDKSNKWVAKAKGLGLSLVQDVFDPDDQSEGLIHSPSTTLLPVSTCFSARSEVE